MWGKKKGEKGTNMPIETLIGGNTQVIGDLIFSGGLHLDGDVKGNVYAKEGADGVLIINEDAHVEGEVRAPSIIIDGRVDGDVYATERIELAANARVNGNVYYAMIEMVMGAEVNGSMIHRRGDVMQADPQKSGLRKAAPEGEPILTEKVG